jgi:hypothetical protein
LIRRTHLKAGRGINIHAEDEGKREVRLIVHGRTESGAEHEVWLEVDDDYLARLTVEIRDHFAVLAANEEKQREYRQRALRMPSGGAS